MGNRQMAYNIHLPLRHQILIQIVALPLLMSDAVVRCCWTSLRRMLSRRSTNLIATPARSAPRVQRLSSS